MPAIDERARHDLFQAVHDQLGPNHADTLMSLLPPVGWADVATKHDLHELEVRLDLRLDVIDERFKGLDGRFRGVDHQFEELEARLGFRFEAIDERFKGIDHQFEALEHKLTSKIERAQKEIVRTVVFALVGSLTSMTSLCLAVIIGTR